ncbi:IS110 family transposase [Spirosoma aerolatum]|uniref:IS110 family transposase n=1 Tax=Spirosoma aerolatum TaxID=1211326 RepID=UPI001FE5DFAB|nr:transposase [Spirosoma aerolatum]
MDFLHYIGIDIAKATLDWAVYNRQGSLLHLHTPNTVAGIKLALRQLKSVPGWDITQVVFCMEHTGIYNAHLLEFLHKLRLPIWLESSLQIKQAGGMQRGKNDTVDAYRIAEYAYRFRDQIRLWQPPRPVIQQLAFLSAARQRLIQAYNLLAGPLAEQDSFINPLLQKQLQRSSRKSLIALKDEQKAIEQQINKLIQNDGRLKELFEWIVSVPGIGSTTATEIIVVTNEMTTITDPKQMACHAGVAPFEYRSGTSIRGKTRVSHQARKRLKA